MFIANIIKRDGKTEKFNPAKITTAIKKAFLASDAVEQENLPDIIVKLTQAVQDNLSQYSMITVEIIQDEVEKILMSHYPDVAKKFILYRDWRTVEREKKTVLKQIMDGIVKIETNDVNNENANMASHTPSGQMMTFASEITKDYTYKYLLNSHYATLHKNGDIHIHDLDYYPTKTTTCLQYDINDLYTRGFHTKNGTIRTPQSIQSYATLATIIFQTNQNEQHGGQSIPAFDFFMAPGVLKTYRKHLLNDIHLLVSLQTKKQNHDEIKKIVQNEIPSILPNEEMAKKLHHALKKIHIDIEITTLQKLFEHAYANTEKDTLQAMEGFIHNLNTMHSRGGNQVVFSSVNYGTDTSPEGRLVTKQLLQATMNGLGHGETPVFPIQIFKVKEGINFSEHDFQKALADYPAAQAGTLQFETPNFDIFLQAIHTTAIALFPNFVFLDATYNQHEKWQKNDPERYRYEVATMGCRTRVFENVNGEKSSLGRGNLSFTTINLPRLAIQAKQQFAHDIKKAKKQFFQSLEHMAKIVAEQLHERLNYQKTALAKQFPFMMSNDVWKGGGALTPNDQLQDVLNQGTLGIGFIGGHNAMVALFGAGHGHHEEAYQTLIEALEILNRVAEDYKNKYQLNYSVLATPAEGLSGRFTKIDQKFFGNIPGVNDREYYVNSFHIDVKEHVSIFEKIQKEAPFHALTKGGHITYVELDGEAKKNHQVILKIVKAMQDNNIGYGSINHPIDTCADCGYKGIVYTNCPVCASENITRMRRITGYLTGNLDSWNSAKKAEESDRVKHGI